MAVWESGLSQHGGCVDLFRRRDAGDLGIDAERPQRNLIKAPTETAVPSARLRSILQLSNLSHMTNHSNHIISSNGGGGGTTSSGGGSSTTTCQNASNKLSPIGRLRSNGYNELLGRMSLPRDGVVLGAPHIHSHSCHQAYQAQQQQQQASSPMVQASSAGVAPLSAYMASLSSYGHYAVDSETPLFDHATSPYRAATMSGGSGLLYSGSPVANEMSPPGIFEGLEPAAAAAAAGLGGSAAAPCVGYLNEGLHGSSQCHHVSAYLGGGSTATAHPQPTSLGLPPRTSSFENHKEQEDRYKEWMSRSRPMCPCSSALLAANPRAGGIFLCRRRSCVHQLLSLETGSSTLPIALSCDMDFNASANADVPSTTTTTTNNNNSDDEHHQEEDDNDDEVSEVDNNNNNVAKPALNPDAPEFVPRATATIVH